MKTPWSFDGEELPDDVSHADASSSWPLYVAGCVLWGLAFVGLFMLYAIGLNLTAGPDAAGIVLHIPYSTIVANGEQMRFLLDLGGNTFGLSVKYHPNVKATMIIADNRIPIG
ncbi:MAG: hypothetical protein SVG88_04470 [Halobacteriales archaeon]|nr:hypothetical protein [Halobacteriales archaeon]